MSSLDALAQRLQAALLGEEPRTVEELLRRGADPNLLLPGGAAAIHLAARARRALSLRCLDALLQGGGDPNARSSEALTPLHVAAAWGCRQGLELLLSRGGDPELRDKDGLRPLDLAEQEGHWDCVQLLQGLDNPSRPPADILEPQPQLEGPQGPGHPHNPFGLPQVTWDSSAPSRGDLGRDRSLETSPGPPSSDTTSKEDGGPPSLLGRYSSSSSSFVTAPEALESDDPALGLPHGSQSPPHTTQGLPGELGDPQLTQDALTGFWDAELEAGVQALTLSLLGAPPAQQPHKVPHPAPPESHFQSSEQDGPSDLELLRGLRALGEDPGPITPFTRPHYLRRLQQAHSSPGHSPELAEALRTGRVPSARDDEDAMVQGFRQPEPHRPWREGEAKASFTYLLLDPRETQDLPTRASSLPAAECLRTFVRGIFYVGKGTRARPHAHLWEALAKRGQQGREACPKLLRIWDIWASGRGVVTLHCFQHVAAVEAYTREACLVEALGLRTLTNQKHGHYYGVATSWPPARRRRLGVHLLQRALRVLLAEGERELRPHDLHARG